MHPPQRLLLPSAALAALAILVVALLPARATADFNGHGGPKATTGVATAITDTTATLNGSVQTGGRVTKYFFQYAPAAQAWVSTPPVELAKNQTGPVSATVTGLAPATLYRYRLVAVNDRGADAGNVQTFTTTAAPAAAPPAPATLPAPAAPAPLPAAAPVAALGSSVVVAPVEGTVLVKVPGAADFAPLGGGSAVPTGAVLDTRKGQVALTTALPGGRTQTATFERGVFQVRQAKSGRGFTDIILRGPALDCGRSSGSTARAAAVTKKKPKKRQLWGRDRGGRFRTHGNNSVATVRGTSWITTDTCTGTRTTVKAGAVSVRDEHRHRTVLVRAGHSYLARRP